MKRITTIIVSAVMAVAMTFSTTSCVNDLDVTPIDPNITLPEDVLNSIEAYQQLLAKCYSSLAVSSSEGPGGEADISGVDGGYGQYMRALFCLQELPTDEASTCWNDATIRDLHPMRWTTSDIFVAAVFSRMYFTIGQCNEFIRRAASAADSLKGEEMDYMVAQARAVRALAYYHAIDLFGNVPFATEANSVGATGPNQILRYDLYEWLVNEIAGENGFREGLRPASATEYGRCSREFATMLLAKLYLNAEVFTSDDPQGRPVISAWVECAEESKTIVESYSTLPADYQSNFRADNHLSNEIIFAVQSDGTNIQSYGITTFLIKGSVPSGAPNWSSALGVDDGWGGLVVTPQFLDLFDEDADSRFLFTDGAEFNDKDIDPHTRSIEDMTLFTYGWCTKKYTNLRSDGAPATLTFPDTDLPVFRAADAYLMLTEAQFRNGGILSDGLASINAVRERAGLEPYSGAGEITERDIIDERGRELYWECMRRQDLIRFGLFTTDEYVWDWKGDTFAGSAVEEHRNLYPIPSTEINSNDKLDQNPGY